jgi:hypothetical protein
MLDRAYNEAIASRSQASTEDNQRERKAAEPERAAPTVQTRSDRTLADLRTLRRPSGFGSGRDQTSCPTPASTEPSSVASPTSRGPADSTGMIAAREITRPNYLDQTVVIVLKGQPIPAGLDVDPDDQAPAPDGTTSAAAPDQQQLR